MPILRVSYTPPTTASLQGFRHPTVRVRFLMNYVSIITYLGTDCQAVYASPKQINAPPVTHPTARMTTKAMTNGLTISPTLGMSSPSASYNISPIFMPF